MRTRYLPKNYAGAEESGLTLILPGFNLGFIFFTEEAWADILKCAVEQQQALDESL